jgi:hypothetical protein
MNVKELTNISPDKLFELLEMSNFDIEKDINKVPDYIKEWLIDLDKIGVDSTKYSLILKSMDSYQWKNFYIFIYARWQKCIQDIYEQFNITLKELPVYNKSINYQEVLLNYMNQDIANKLFFINTLQIFFVPYPN